MRETTDQPAAASTPRLVYSERWDRILTITLRKIGIAALVGSISGLIIVLTEGSDAVLPEDFIIYPLSFAIASPIYYMIFASLAKAVTRSISTSFQQISIQKRSEELQENLDADFFNNLVKINFKYIDKYYLQTQLQADKAFYTALATGLIGLVVMVVGVVQMFKGFSTPAYVTAGSGIISQFIASVFFYLYNRTVLKMSEYHKKLVLTQNIGLALRVTQDLPPEQQVSARLQLIDRLTTDINSLLVHDPPSSDKEAA